MAETFGQRFDQHTDDIITSTTKLMNELADRIGLYVWEKYTAQGGDFIGYVVADDENSYPNGGMLDGYYYEIYKKLPTQTKTVTPVPEGMTVTPDVGYLLEKVVLNGFSEGITPEMFGCTKMAIDEQTFTSDGTAIKSLPFNHTLGTTPKVVFIKVREIVQAVNQQGNTHLAHAFGFIDPISLNTENLVSFSCGAYNSSTKLSTYGTTSHIKVSSNTIIMTGAGVANGGYVFAGVPYDIITMA